MAKKTSPGAGLRILVIGAHPDDCELSCGGTAALWAARGHTVRFVSVTNGGTGHYRIGGVELVRRRAAEAKAAAGVIGIESQILPILNGGLVPTIEYRAMIIRLMREFMPDLVVTHRPWDYHPDHRYTSTLVADSIYVVTVPNNCPEVPALRRSPCLAYLSDHFRKPAPFQPDFVVAIDSVMEKKLDMILCHESQVLEWIPWNQRIENQVPKGRAARRRFVMKQHGLGSADEANRFRAQLTARYGEKRGNAVKFAEAFEKSEYGSRFTPAFEKRVFGGL